MPDSTGGYEPTEQSGRVNGGQTVVTLPPDLAEALRRMLEQHGAQTNSADVLSEDVKRALAFVAAALESIRSALALQDNPIKISKIDPASGRAAGGASVTIHGSHFLPGSTVLFGANAAKDVSVSSTDKMQVTTPPGSAGPVEVVVNTIVGSATLPGGYTYSATGVK